MSSSAGPSWRGRIGTASARRRWGAQKRANLWPLTDTAADAAPDTANTLSFTVDISACIARESVAPGTYSFSLTAAGETLSGGASRAAQMLYVAIP
jgi:hypothetical protein